MDYMARIKELDTKLENEGLTEIEEAENSLLYSMALLELWESQKKRLEALQGIVSTFENKEKIQ